MTKTLAWVGLAVLSAYAVFMGGAWFGIYEPVLRLLSVVLVTIALVAWALAARRDAAWRPRSVLLPAIAACLASLAISTALSRFPLISLEYLAYAVVMAALYLLLVRLLSMEFFRRRFVSLAGALFVAIVVAYLALSANQLATWFGTLGAATVPPLRPGFESLTFGNPSTVLTMVALLAIPLVAAQSWTTRRGVAGVVTVLALTALVALVSGSRAGWLALAVAGLVGVVLAAANGDARARVREALAGRVGGGASRVVLGAAAVALVAGLVLVGPAIVKRATEGGEGNRVTFVRIALELFSESPIVGTGPGTWVIQRPALTQPDEMDEYIPHAHNVYAQTLGELGLAGALAGLILVLALGRIVRDAVRDPDQGRRRWGWATLIGLVYFATHQLLDFYPNFPSVLFAAAIPVAYLDATGTRPWPALGLRLPRLANLATRAAVPALAAALLALAAQEIPAIAADEAVERANRGEWAAADGPARTAAAQDPRISPYLFTAGLTAAHAGDHAAAAAYFEEVVRRDDLPEAWLNLAAEQVALGQGAAAVPAIEAALRVGHQRAAVSVAAGELALRVGNTDLARDAFAAAAATSPSLLADEWWGVEPARQDLRAAVVEAVTATTPAYLQWEVWLMLGQVYRARAIATTAGMEPAAFDFIDAWGGSEPAYEKLVGRCRAEPLRIHLLFWCARVEGRRGNDAAAEAFRYLANAQIGGAYRAGAELRIRQGPAVGRSLEGNPAIFWGPYTYRRFTPWDVLVPSLLHLTLE